jgi:hypothetical protein
VLQTENRLPSLNKNPALNNAGLQESLKFCGANPSRGRLAELFSGFFFVAASRLNSPRFSQVLIRPASLPVKSLRCEAAGLKGIYARFPVDLALVLRASTRAWLSL